jgi:probable phosphomutase (TIGR03848 family)
MATVILVRHGRTTANAAGILSGRMPGVRLDDVGLGQARKTANRLSAVPIAALVSSPLERTKQTSRIILAAQNDPPKLSISSAITEADYGDWQGRQLSDLVKEPLWSVVQRRPSEATFPGGESMTGMQVRAVKAIRRYDAKFASLHSTNAVWVAVSHADIIKSILADALGMHLDLFQRINVGPASVSIIRYGADGPEVLATNTDSGDLGWLASRS